MWNVIGAGAAWMIVGVGLLMVIFAALLMGLVVLFALVGGSGE